MTQYEDFESNPLSFDEVAQEQKEYNKTIQELRQQIDSNQQNKIK